MSASSPARSLLLPLGAMPAQAFGGGNWRTPHLGQISAFALMIAPHSEQNFSSAAFCCASTMILRYHLRADAPNRQNRVFAGFPASLFFLPLTYVQYK